MTFESPMLFSVGFIVTFLFGDAHRCSARQPAAGLPPVGLVLRGRALPLRALRHHRVRHLRQRVLLVPQDDRTHARRGPGPLAALLAHLHRLHTTFLVQHWLGNSEGMPRRRYADYLPSDGFTELNIVSTVGAFIPRLSTLPFLWNVFRNYRYGGS